MTFEERDVALMLANPFYCLRTIDPVFRLDHEPIITEKRFIAAGVRLIKEEGAEAYIRLILENLKHPKHPAEATRA